MKKILRTLLMITCVLGLTACGEANEVSDIQNYKIQTAETMSSYVIDIMSNLAESGTFDDILAEINNVELADQFNQVFESATGYADFKCEGKGIRSGLASFEEGLETLGGIVSVGEPTTTYDKKEIKVNVPITGINKDASVELIFSNDLYFDMSACTLNVDETFGDLMGRAGLNTLIGMMTVFTVLILISLIISLFKFIPNIQNAFKKKENVPAQVTSEAKEVAAPVEEELADDTELVAVIAAAIAAYEGTSADGFQVRSIKRANTKNWKNN